MSQDIRRELISRNLGIKPISHGQIYTFQIALPDSRKQLISLEQRQAIEESLLTHQSNLVSLILRRTNAYDDEDIEYELVYGADWLQVSQELNIEKVWAWVFDLTDEQVNTTIAEMKALAGTSEIKQPIPNPTDSAGGISLDIAALIDTKLQLATDSIRNSIAPILNGIRSDLDERLRVLNHRIDNLDRTGDDSNGLNAVLERLDFIQKQLTASQEPIIENPINLLEASEQDIEIALKQVKTQDKQIRAAIAAVQFWKQSERKLTWNNLRISVKANNNSPYKIKGFAEGTFKQLQKVAVIPQDQ